ncbi:MAG: DEAD/DEAH box helicase [Methanobrevibacter sp.]|nr:DEAD/DEAH box helicase [Candidatus Methanovirga aequatorialis]
MREFLSTRQKWKKLNPIQKDAIPLILDKKDTLIIAPTASGKTEAVLIPIFDEILKERLKPTSVLYVAPLKALINDMHNRIESWGKYFGLTVTKWHGDVSKSQKDIFIKNPTDFLAITPESLEVIMMNRSLDAKKNIFKNLKYVIVDEIHIFASSDRGTQLNSILNRIRAYTNNNITKIGLSATVGNPVEVGKWLNYIDPPAIVKNNDIRNFYYKVFHENNFMEDCKNRGNENENKRQEEVLSQHLKKYIGRKILIFSLSRAGVEYIYNNLKKNIKKENIYLHHSSINTNLREEGEYKFKNDKHGFMVSTSTLELGIDIGDIGIVFQVFSPKNVSSFLQRIGRSGRKSKNQRSIITTSDEDLLFTLAQISLINEDRIEKIAIPTNAKDIYFHQILSSVFEVKKIRLKDLFYYLKDAYVFSKISKEDFERIIKYMDENGFLDIYNGFASLGYEFERRYGKANFKEFFSVFCPSYDFTVLEGKEEIGTLDPSLATGLKVGDKFVLAGQSWIVDTISHEKFRIWAKKTGEGNIPHWNSDGMAIDNLISRKCYDILCEDFNTAFLQSEDNKSRFDDESKEMIYKLIQIAKEKGFEKGIVPIEIDRDMNKVFVYTFAGNKANILLSTIFQLFYELYDVNDTAFYSSFKIKKNSLENITFSDIVNVLYTIEEKFNQENEEETLDLINRTVGKFYKNKFINFLPERDQAILKMNIIFDKDSLLEVIKNNSPVEVFNVDFDKWFDYNYNQEDVPENSGK